MPYRQPKILASLCLLSLLLVSPASGLHPAPEDSLGPCAPRMPDVAALEGGGFVAVWVEDAQIPDSEFFRRVVWGQVFDRDAHRISPRLRLAPTNEDHPAVRVVPSEDGGFLIGFSENDELVIVDFDRNGDVRNDFVLGAWNRPTPALAAGVGDFLSIVSTPSPDEVEVLRFRASGEVESTAVLQEEAGTGIFHPAAAVLAGGDSAVAYLRRSPPPHTPLANQIGQLRLRRFTAEGVPIGDPRVLTEAAYSVDLTPRPGGGLVAAYLEFPRVVAEVLDAQWNTIERIELGEVQDVQYPTVSVSPDGETFTVAWSRTRADSPPIPETQLVTRTFGVDGTIRSPVQTWATSLPHGGRVAPNRIARPRLTHLDPNRLAVAWWHQRTLALDPSPSVCAVSEGAFVRTFDATATCPEEDSLCLQDERFAVRVAWEDPRTGDSGVGTPKPVTDDTGTFWFFEEQNLELMVKVLDARPINGHFWVFFGSLTDVEFELVVTDLLTGESRTYTNPPFEMASQADTTAFPSP